MNARPFGLMLCALGTFLSGAAMADAASDGSVNLVQSGDFSGGSADGSMP